MTSLWIIMDTFQMPAISHLDHETIWPTSHFNYKKSLGKLPHKKKEKLWNVIITLRQSHLNTKLEGYTLYVVSLLFGTMNPSMIISVFIIWYNDSQHDQLFFLIKNKV